MSLKLLFDLNGLVFFAAPVVGGCKGLPVSFWTGAERSTSGCRPRPAWSSAPTEPALEVRGCAYCGMLEKLEFVGTLRADAAGEAERAPDIAEPGLRGGRRFDKGISSSLLCEDSFSLVSVPAMASLSLVCVGGTNDPRESDDGRPILVLGIGAREPKQNGSQYLSSHWIVGQPTTMPHLALARTGPLLLLTRSRRVPVPQLRFCFSVGTGTTRTCAPAICIPNRWPSTGSNLIYSALVEHVFPSTSMLRDSRISVIIIFTRSLVLRRGILCLRPAMVGQSRECTGSSGPRRDG